MDLTVEMLRGARAASPDGVRFVAGDVAELPFVDGSFDVVVSTSSMHHWKDAGAALHEIRRVLRPGGNVYLTDWSWDPWIFRPFALFLRAIDRTVHRIYGLAELTRLLDEAGFRVQRSRAYRVARVWGLMTVVASRA